MKTQLPRQMARKTTLAVFASMMLALAAAPEPARADAEIYKQTLQSTAWIVVEMPEGTSRGSGVLVDLENRLVITNFHVVGDQRDAHVFFPSMKDGRPIAERKFYLDKIEELSLKGRVIAVDRKRDLAIIQIPSVPEGVPAIEIAPESVSPGAEVHSLGNPGSTDVLWAYTSGRVRAVYRKQFRTGAGEHDFTVVETSSPINAGDSGGPVVNAQGQLVGISQAMDPKARLVSYCVDVTEIQGFLSEDWKPVPSPVTEVLNRAGLTFSQHASGPYYVEFTPEGTKKQTVFITRKTEYFGKAEVRKIWALAVPVKKSLTAEVAMALLNQNARTKMGAWTIERAANGDYLIIFCVKLDATATPDALKSAMEYVSKVSNAMQAKLTNGVLVAGTNDR